MNVRSGLSAVLYLKSNFIYGDKSQESREINDTVCSQEVTISNSRKNTQP